MVETMVAQEKKIEREVTRPCEEGPEHGNEVGGSIWSKREGRLRAVHNYSVE